MWSLSMETKLKRRTLNLKPRSGRAHKNTPFMSRDNGTFKTVQIRPTGAYQIVKRPKGIEIFSS